jgi:hypothetical protein
MAAIDDHFGAGGAHQFGAFWATGEDCFSD